MLHPIRLSDEKRMGRRRAARTAFRSVSTGRALPPLTPTDLVKNVPRKFATLWVGTGLEATGVALPVPEGEEAKERDVGSGRGGEGGAGGRAHPS